MKKIAFLIFLELVVSCRTTQNSSAKNDSGAEPETPDLAVYVGCYETKQAGQIGAGVEVANEADHVCIENSTFDQLSFVFEKSVAGKEDAKFVVTYSESCEGDCIRLKEGTLVVQLGAESAETSTLTVSDQASGQVSYELTRTN
jgi:hypothetical protein